MRVALMMRGVDNALVAIWADRKLTKPELILRLRRDDGQLAALLGLSSHVVSSMEEHREFNELFGALDCQRGSRGAITFNEFQEYVDGRYKDAAAAQLTWVVAAAALLLLLLLLLGLCLRARAQRRQERHGSEKTD
jgi:phospholipase C